MGRRRKLYAHNILDFRPGVDRVIRVGKHGHLHDPEGTYADQKVDGDLLDDTVRANLDALTDQQAARMFETIRRSPFLSPEGKRERLSYLLASGRVKLSFQEF